MTDQRYSSSGIPSADDSVRELLKQLVEAVKANHPPAMNTEHLKALVAEMQELNRTSRVELHELHTATKVELQELNKTSKAELEELNKTSKVIAAHTEVIATNTLALEALPQLVAALAAVAAPAKTAFDELKDKLTAISEAILGKGGYNKPTYKRTLRAGESLAVLTVPGVQDPSLRGAQKTVKDTAGKELTKLLNGVTLAERLEKRVGAKEALDAVKAALIDRPNLDQTTRLLLTTDNVLEVAFLEIVDKGTPSFWDTLATVEAIRSKLRGRATTLFEDLVKGHAKERGWNDDAIKLIKNKLSDRYSSLQ